MARIVKYHNDLNSMPMRSWAAEEMDLFFSIILKIRDKGCKELVLNTDDLKLLCGSDQRTYRWNSTIEKFQDKVMSLRYKEKTDSTVLITTLFSRCMANLQDGSLAIRVSDDFEYIVNKLTRNFTVWELKEFTELKSTYSKTMYRLLKQWRTVGKKEFSLEQFKDLLDVPNSYTANNINQRVLSPIEKELPKFFENLKIKVLKKNTQGTPVIGYCFTWIPEETGEWNPNKYTAKKEHEKNTTSDKIGDYLKDKMLEDFKASQKSLTEDQLNIDNFKDL